MAWQEDSTFPGNALHGQAFLSQIHRARLVTRDSDETRGREEGGIDVVVRSLRLHQRAFDHAYALWAEAAMLTPSHKENPIPVPLPIVLLIRKSVEVCRLAEVIHKMAQDQRGKSGNHSKSVRRRTQNVANSGTRKSEQNRPTESGLARRAGLSAPRGFLQAFPHHRLPGRTWRREREESPMPEPPGVHPYIQQCPNGWMEVVPLATSPGR